MLQNQSYSTAVHSNKCKHGKESGWKPCKNNTDETFVDKRILSQCIQRFPKVVNKFVKESTDDFWEKRSNRSNLIFIAFFLK